jgi:hypothetical protein
MMIVYHASRENHREVPTMTTPTNRPPLWLVMHAAELRAIAGRIKNDFATCIVGNDPVMEVVDWLRAEADRAEAGDDTTNS